jgi:hypothetical protein
MLIDTEPNAPGPAGNDTRDVRDFTFASRQRCLGGSGNVHPRNRIYLHANVTRIRLEQAGRRVVSLLVQSLNPAARRCGTRLRERMKEGA